jgi:hypothetical protein
MLEKDETFLTNYEHDQKDNGAVLGLPNFAGAIPNVF